MPADHFPDTAVEAAREFYTCIELQRDKIIYWL